MAIALFYSLDFKMNEREAFEKWCNKDKTMRELSPEIVFKSGYKAALSSQEPVGLVYAGQDGYGASLKQGLKHGSRLYTSPQPDLTDKVKELEARLKSNAECESNTQFKLVEKVKELEAEIARLREALQALWDVQNGCPLPKYEADYAIARNLTINALANYHGEQSWAKKRNF